jgi:hypothetical protein
MRAFALLCGTLLSIVPAARAEEKDPPPGESPQLWLASAAQRDGKVVIQIAHQDYVEPRKPVVAEAMKWKNFRQVTLGETVQAFGVDGKPLEPKSVLKALAEPKCVAVFVRNYVRDRPKDLADPDPFYLAMLREGTVVLVVGGGDIFPLEP